MYKKVALLFFVLASMIVACSSSLQFDYDPVEFQVLGETAHHDWRD